MEPSAGGEGRLRGLSLLPYRLILLSGIGQLLSLTASNFEPVQNVENCKARLVRWNNMRVEFGVAWRRSTHRSVTVIASITNLFIEMNGRVYISASATFSSFSIVFSHSRALETHESRFSSFFLFSASASVRRGGAFPKRAERCA